MNNYRQRGGSSRGRGGSAPRKSPAARGSSMSGGLNRRKGMVIICGIIAAVVIILLIVGLGNFGGEKEDVKLDSEAVFADNITVQGIAVGGMNAAQAKNALAPAANSMLLDANIAIIVPKQDTENTEDTEGEEAAQPTASQTVSNGDGTATVTYAPEQSGIYADMDTTLAEALNFSKSQGKVKEDAQAVNFDLKYAVDETVLRTALETDSAGWGTPAVNASYTLETTASEEDLTTNAAPVKTEGQNGYNVDIDALVAQIKTMVDSQQLGTVTAPTMSVEPEVTMDSLGEIEVIGEYSTSFSSSGGSRAERMYNIWKISSVLNGVRIAAEDTISVNDIVGPRTEESGWKLAPGIENGVYTDQAGGGICQVSSTLYIAALKGELKIEERVHHTIPSTYVPMGLDSTISTDWPDLVLTNNTEYSMLLGINCNVPDRTVEVKIYGVKPRDYTLRFESVTTETIPVPEDQYVANSETPEGQLVNLTSGREGYVVDVYKIWYDKTSGEETDRKRIYTDTYKAIGAIYNYNPNTPPETILATAGVTPVPEVPVEVPVVEPTPEPTVAPTPEPTVEPTPDPTPEPTASAAAAEG